MRAPLLILPAVAACGPRYLAPEAQGWDHYQPYTADEAMLRTAASMPHLELLHHDVALLCVDTGCEVATVDADGYAATGLRDVASAWRFDSDRILIQGLDLRLELDDGTVLAKGALDPRVAGDGRRALFVQLEGEPDHFEMGDVGYMTVLDVQTGQQTRITDNPADTAPWLVPHSDDVLFTSARTGLASLWIKQGDAEPRQLTNVGQTEVGADFVPVPSRELVFLPDQRKVVYSAHYGTHELWSVDLDTGAAKHVGPGRLPANHPEGGIVAVHDDDPALGLQIVRYDGGEL